VVVAGLATLVGFGNEEKKRESRVKSPGTMGHHANGGCGVWGSTINQKGSPGRVRRSFPRRKALLGTASSELSCTTRNQKNPGGGWLSKNRTDAGLDQFVIGAEKKLGAWGNEKKCTSRMIRRRRNE